MRRIVEMMTWKRFVVLAAVFAGLTVAGTLGARPAPGQAADSAAASAAKFDHASVTPSHAADRVSHREIRPDGLAITNVTLKELIEYAYGVESYQVAGTEDWIDKDRFDVVAEFKTGGQTGGQTGAQAGGPQVPQMLRGMLADAFGLQVKQDSRPMAVYALTAASGGAKLKEAVAGTAPNGEPLISIQTKTVGGTGEVTVTGPVSALAGFLSGQLSREVVDKTGMAGTYAMSLRWETTKSTTESIRAALEQELGLKLSSEQGQVRMVTVTQVERPKG